MCLVFRQKIREIDIWRARGKKPSPQADLVAVFGESFAILFNRRIKQLGAEFRLRVNRALTIAALHFSTRSPSDNDNQELQTLYPSWKCQLGASGARSKAQ